ncbi:DUF1707 SHOCT-like domain-containing protein [Marinactinospora thermotolerans]|uniref:DUF1707 SHOCT-like domain-containing protein n=1 Tax=Marinactinospora thermotolerans TaxID=531310 RepID=UPI001F338FC9|nr:DUF1707 domain-containing protein [Marinactinospora thermotolerans]
MNESVPPAGLRAANADRERVLEVLRAAVADGRLDLSEFDERADRVNAARTLGDLAPVTADLLPPERQPILLDEAPVAALFGNQTRSGRWVVQARQVVFALGGTAEVDMREALLVRGHIRMTASALFGRIRLQVPEGVEVRVRGWSFLGLRSTSTRPPRSGDAPVLEIQGFSLLGSLRVSSPRRRRGLLGRGRERRGLA